MQNLSHEYVLEDKAPSLRILKRIQQGKRNAYGLSRTEKTHIQNRIGFIRRFETERQWANRLIKFLTEGPLVQDRQTFWGAVGDENTKVVKGTTLPEQELDDELKTILTHVEDRIRN